jgi:hypothetical protein
VNDGAPLGLIGQPGASSALSRSLAVENDGDADVKETDSKPKPKLVRFKVAKVILGDPSDEALDKLIEAEMVDLVRLGKSKYLTIESIDRLIARGGATY